MALYKNLTSFLLFVSIGLTDPVLCMPIVTKPKFLTTTQFNAKFSAVCFLQIISHFYLAIFDLLNWLQDIGVLTSYFIIKFICDHSLLNYGFEKCPREIPCALIKEATHTKIFS